MERVADATRTGDVALLANLATELEQLGNPSDVAAASNVRGTVAFLTADFENALAYYQMGARQYEELGDIAGHARLIGNIGSVHIKCGAFDEALEYLHRALSLHELVNNTLGVAQVTGNIGSVLFALGSFPDALEHYHRALALQEQLGNQTSVATVLGNIGNVLLKTEMYDDALEVYQRALHLNEQLNSRPAMASVLGSIGIVLNHTGRTDEALTYYRRAFELQSQLGDHAGMSNVLGHITNLLIESSRFDEARTSFAELMAMDIDDPAMRITRMIIEADLLAHDGAHEASRDLRLQALQEAASVGLRDEEAIIHRSLRDMSETLNDFPAFIHHNREYLRINDEINGRGAALKTAAQQRERLKHDERKEREKILAVLHSTLPPHVADRVARGEVVNDHYDNAAVLFLDIVGFTTFSDRIPAAQVVHVLDQIFTALDALCERHDVTKIKTIGDAYMAVAFEGNTAVRLAACALEMMATLSNLNIDVLADLGGVRVRIGLHVGPVTAGIIGTQRMQYDVWGDTVNTASRMESLSEPGRVHVTKVFVDEIESMIKNQEADLESGILSRGFSYTSRGEIEVKGKGRMTTYWLERL